MWDPLGAQAIMRRRCFEESHSFILNHVEPFLGQYVGERSRENVSEDVPGECLEKCPEECSEVCLRKGSE
jgi:hypothetical protein